MKTNKAIQALNLLLRLCTSSTARVAVLSAAFLLLASPVARADVLTLGPCPDSGSGGPPGAVFTSDVGCNKVNGNIYALKTDVYLNGGSKAADRLNGNYYVRVTSPMGKVLGTNSALVHFDTSVCLQLWAIVFKFSDGTQGYDDTDNPGGEYQVEVSCDVNFASSNTKYDNFKVRAGATCLNGADSCISCPEPFTACVTDFKNGCLGAFVTYTDPIVINGTLDPNGCTPASGSFFCLGQTTVTCTANQGALSCSFVVTVSNTGDCGGTSQGCIISGPNGGDLGCNPGSATIPTCAGVTLSTSDTCSTESFTCTQDSDKVVGCVHSRRIHASATACDGSTCSYDQTFTWTVDTAGPTFSGCGPVDLHCNPTPPTCADALALVSATDPCSGASITLTGANCSDGGVTTVGTCGRSEVFTISATDACGVGNSCTVTYTWTVDTTAPTITCPPNLSVVQGGTYPLLATDLDTFLAQGGTVSDTCGGLTLITHTETTASGCVTVITRTYQVQDGCLNKSATCTQTITVTPKSLITNTERCCFDCNNTLAGPQFRLVFTPDVTQPGCFKLNASNPGQFIYNVFLSGTAGSSVSLVISVPYPFVTQGAVPVHEYDGVLGYVNPGPLDSTCPAPTCLTPGNDVSSAFTFSPSALTVACGSLLAGTAAQTITVTGTMPQSGFLFVAVHLDYGLKICRGYNQNTTTPYPDAVQCGTTTVLIPGTETYTFGVSGNESDSINLQSYNVFKKNPGVGGGVNHIVFEAGANVPEGVPGLTVVLTTGSSITSQTTVATTLTDNDGWYILPYKYTGKATTLYVTLNPGKTNQQQKSITIKANGYVEVDFNQ